MWNLTLNSTESTNDDLRAAYEAGAPHGAWIRALSQTKGRGRFERQWISEPGNLYFSFLLREARFDSPTVSWLPLQVAVLVAETLNSEIVNPIKIKWPNDLMVKADHSFAKVGGILCEGIFSEKEIAVIVGIGINFSSSPDVSDRKTDWVQWKNLGKKETAVDQAFEKLKEVFQRELKLIHEKSQPIDQSKHQWKKRFFAHSVFLPGDTIRWRENGKNAAEEKHGYLKDLGSQGQLIVESRSDFEKPGNVKELYSEEVSIPFGK